MPTATHTVPNNEFVDLGSTPCFVQLQGDQAATVVIAATKPVAATNGIRLDNRRGEADIAAFSGEKAWAKADTLTGAPGTATIVVVRPA